MELNHQTMLYVPVLTAIDRGEWTFFVDGAAPNWVSTDARGTWLLRRLMDGPCRFSALVSSYTEQFAMESGKAWIHVQAFISEALRHRLVSLAPIERALYRGRAHYLDLSRLRPRTAVLR
jgi:hypothetical protein